MEINREQLKERTGHLKQIAAELKTELFGIEAIIDRVIESIRAWYVMPEIIKRPVIVCLWGLTGTGKTQLTRSLAKKLKFFDRFVEIQMDGQKSTSAWRSDDSVGYMLNESNVKEGQQGILVLDEFQRFRTIDDKGEDVVVKAYNDVWQLLSDGRLPPSFSFMKELEMALAESMYDIEEEREEAKPAEGVVKSLKKQATSEKKPPKKFVMRPYQAREFRSMLKLPDSIADIMSWPPEIVNEKIAHFQKSSDSWETDYSKLLIFVSGNLDEMYSSTAKSVEDCDTDADIFHDITKKLTMIDVKKALGKRFKPEQVARLGNSHVIYPSFSQATYEKIIHHTVGVYVKEIEESSGFVFEMEKSLFDGVYANGVFPSQGTRPLFSSIHVILSSSLVNAVLWACEESRLSGKRLLVSMNSEKQMVRFRDPENELVFHEEPVSLDLTSIRNGSTPDFRALLAVHEAGHALVYAELFKKAPREVKINIASFEGGYNSFARFKCMSKQALLDSMVVGMAGRAAETLVFGDSNVTSGSMQDIAQATKYAAEIVRELAMGGRFSYTDATSNPGSDQNTDVAATNDHIEKLVEEATATALTIVTKRHADLISISQKLLEKGLILEEEFAKMFSVEVATNNGMPFSYANEFEKFVQNSLPVLKVA